MKWGGGFTRMTLQRTDDFATTVATFRPGTIIICWPMVAMDATPSAKIVTIFTEAGVIHIAATTKHHINAKVVAKLHI